MIIGLNASIFTPEFFTFFLLQGTSGISGVMQVVMKDPPTFVTRAEAKYVRSVGGKVEFPCAGAGEPTPTVSWRRVDGKPLPRRRHKGKRACRFFVLRAPY